MYVRDHGIVLLNVVEGVNTYVRIQSVVIVSCKAYSYPL